MRIINYLYLIILCYTLKIVSFVLNFVPGLSLIQTNYSPGKITMMSMFILLSDSSIFLPWVGIYFGSKCLLLLNDFIKDIEKLTDELE